MASEPRKVLFVGPTFRGISGEAHEALDAFDIRSPATRGDVDGLMETEPGVLVLVDGLFHDALAVGHRELRNAVERGWQVWGLSSMGAIRAYEMRHLGVRGYGQVYERFCAEEDFQDDEVALLHTAAPDYTPITEPLIHLRVALEAYVEARILQGDQRDAILDRLKSLWYGDRTLELFFRLLRERAGAEFGSVDPDRGAISLRADFDRHRIKTRDLERFIKERVWEKE